VPAYNELPPNSSGQLSGKLTDELENEKDQTNNV